MFYLHFYCYAIFSLNSTVISDRLLPLLILEQLKFSSETLQVMDLCSVNYSSSASNKKIGYFVYFYYNSWPITTMKVKNITWFLRGTLKAFVICAECRMIVLRRSIKSKTFWRLLLDFLPLTHFLCPGAKISTKNFCKNTIKVFDLFFLFSVSQYYVTDLW